MKDLKHWEHVTSWDWGDPTKEPKIEIKKEGGRAITVENRNGSIFFIEGIVTWYEAEFTKEEALELVEELRQWIEAQNV